MNVPSRVLLAILLSVFFHPRLEGQQTFRLGNGQTGATQCPERTGSVFQIQWDLEKGTPCEITLRSSGVVQVIVIGANPAFADYRLRVTSLTATPSASTQPPRDSITRMRPAAPPVPDLSGPVRDLAVAFPALEAAGRRDTTSSSGKQRVVALRHLNSANQIVGGAAARIVGFGGLRLEAVCSDNADDNRYRSLDLSSFWSVAENANHLHGLLARAVRDVVPPVTEVEISAAKQCVKEIEASTGWSTLLSLGPSAVTRAAAESQGRLTQLVRDATRARDSLQVLSFAAWSTAQQGVLLDLRNALVSELNAIIGNAERAIANDFTAANVAGISQALTQASDWAGMIMNSQSQAIVQASVDGERGASRNVVLDWQPTSSAVGVASGSRMVVLDRFKGLLLQVTGAAGFAGGRTHEVVKEPAYSPTGTLLTDSVDHVANSRLVWRPALSTGLSLNAVNRGGFLAGVGVELAVLSGDGGDVTTRIVAPVLHLGRDDRRFFIGMLQGGNQRFAFPGGETRLRLPTSVEAPPNLVVNRKRRWPPDLYIGIVVGGRSLNPTTDSR